MEQEKANNEEAEAPLQIEVNGVKYIKQERYDRDVLDALARIV